MSAMIVGWAVSAGPAPMPLSTQAPMKLLYEFALALHILLPKQIKVEAINTGRLPKQVWMGTQIKLLNPRTKMATPVNCTTFVRLESKA